MVSAWADSGPVLAAEKVSLNGNPATPAPRPSRESYVPPHMRNRESQPSNVSAPPPPAPSAPSNPSTGWNRDVGGSRGLSRTGSWAAESEKSEKSEKSLGWDEKPFWGEKPSWGSSGGRGWGNTTSTARSGGAREREVNPFAQDLKNDDLFEQENTGINFDAYEDIPVETSGGNVPPPVNTFAEIDLGEALNLNIKRCKFAKPTPVQKYAIPISLAGRDLMACAQTGSGKTAAFCFPIIAGILRSNPPPRPRAGRKTFPFALILSPTRELSCQVRFVGFQLL